MTLLNTTLIIHNDKQPSDNIILKNQEKRSATIGIASLLKMIDKAKPANDIFIS